MTSARSGRKTPHRRGLRARAAADSLHGLADRELLALLLMRAAPRVDVARLADTLLAGFGSLEAVATAPDSELATVPGLGAAGVLDLRLLHELTVRLARVQAVGRPIISSWTALLAYVRAALGHMPREQFRALFLDRKNQLLRDELVADGTVDHAPVYPREIVRRALELSACAVILVHNHPSGDPTPSSADVAMTRQVIEAGRLLNIAVHDHLVVGRDKVASFRALGLI